MSKLFIVGTPIGNLKDLTFRALETLKSVDVIACEDTRVTRKLLNHFAIKGKKLLSYHSQNERNSALGIINLLQQNLTVALVSDAGMPVLADPGFEVIRQARNYQIPVEVIPGVSAQTVVATISGLSPFYHFLGFLSPKTGKRQNELRKLTPGVYIIYVSPYKLVATLLDIIKVHGATTAAFLAKELTKLHEQHYRGPIETVLKEAQQFVKGEYTLAFEVLKNVAK